MFNSDSRYERLDTLSCVTDSGDEVVYVARRFVPLPRDRPLATELLASEADRPDLVAARSMHAPEGFWRLCDDNVVMDPFELTDVPGRRIRVLLPSFSG